jgi:hypothetical protein
MTVDELLLGTFNRFSSAHIKSNEIAGVVVISASNQV